MWKARGEWYCGVLFYEQKMFGRFFLWKFSVGDHFSLFTSELKTIYLQAHISYFNSQIKYIQDAIALILDVLRMELKIEYQSQEMLTHLFKEH